MNWRVTLLIIISFLVGFLVLVAILTRPPVAPHEALYINGIVITMDASDTLAEAVLVREGQIVAVGESEDLLSRVDDDTEVVDLYEVF